MKLNKKQTERFVWLWNKANGYPQGLCDKPNMRYITPDLVTWNEYDAPRVSLGEIKSLLKRIENESL